MSTDSRNKIWVKSHHRLLWNLLSRVGNRPRISKFIWQSDYIDQLSPAELKLGLSLAINVVKSDFNMMSISLWSMLRVAIVAILQDIEIKMAASTVSLNSGSAMYVIGSMYIYNNHMMITLYLCASIQLHTACLRESFKILTWQKRCSKELSKTLFDPIFSQNKQESAFWHWHCLRASSWTLLHIWWEVSERQWFWPQVWFTDKFSHIIVTVPALGS